jgi:hypothetical protein
MKRRERLKKKYGDCDPTGQEVESMSWRAIRTFLFGVLFLVSFSLINLVARSI